MSWLPLRWKVNQYSIKGGRIWQGWGSSPPAVAQSILYRSRNDTEWGVQSPVGQSGEGMRVQTTPTAHEAPPGHTQPRTSEPTLTLGLCSQPLFYFLHTAGCSQLHGDQTDSSALSPLTWTTCYTFNSSSQILTKLKMRELSLKCRQTVWSCGSLTIIHEKLQLYLPRSEVKNQWPHHIYK